MIDKVIKLIKNPKTESKKINFFLKINLKKISEKINFIKKYRKHTENKLKEKEFSRLSLFYKNGNKIKIHFGCGPRVLKGWLNLDLFYVPYDNYLKYYTGNDYPESIRGTKDDFYAIDILKTGLPLPDNSVDSIFHEDFFEHLDQKEQVIFLAETFRVLKPGSIHRINTPNLLVCVGKYSDFKKGKSGVFVEEWEKWDHKNIPSETYINEIAKMVGYSKILFNSKNNSTSKEIPFEYRPGDNRETENSNVFADLIK